MTSIITLDKLSVRYESVAALTDVSLELLPGHVVAVVGPNGAGKTTLFRALFGEVLDFSGNVTVGDLHPFDPADQRRLWSVARLVEDEAHAVYLQLSVREYLEFVARAFAVPEASITSTIEDIVGNLGLVDQIDTRIKKLSHGMKRKVHVASGFLSGDAGPRVVALDEPFSGLDPPARLVLGQFLRQYVNPDGHGSERIVLISSHNLAELSSIASYIVLIDKGRIVRHGSIRELLAAHEQDLSYELTLFDTSANELKRYLDDALRMDCNVLDERTLRLEGINASSLQHVLDCVARAGTRFRIRELKEELTPLERLYHQIHLESVLE